jgi:hypothetical protein
MTPTVYLSLNLTFKEWLKIKGRNTERERETETETETDRQTDTERSPLFDSSTLLLL